MWMFIIFTIILFFGMLLGVVYSEKDPSNGPKKPLRKTSYKPDRRRDFNRFIPSSSKKHRLPKQYDPFDSHWENSFDWKDEDNDGYDDRDDGFWNEREF